MQNRLSGYGPSLIVLATAMLVLFAGPSAVRKLTFERSRAQIIQATHRLEGDNILEQINQAYRDIADRVEPSVVHVSVQHLIPNPRGGAPQAAISSGSGWVYDIHGHIVTNYHVVRDARRIEVQLDSGELRTAELLGYDDTTDIAVLSIPEGRLNPAQLGDPDTPVNQGDMVFAFGSPFDFRFSMSSGVVSGKGRSVGVIRDERGRRFGYENFIQVDAAINPGNSGGPLTNYRGEVIGMNTAIATGRETSLEEGQFAGIGLAIPLDMIKPVVEQLVEQGFVTKGFLGVEIETVEGRVAQYFRARGFNGQGIWVKRIIEGDPADRAGLKVEDVITHVNERPTESRPQLQSIISSIRPGETVKLIVWRYNTDTERGETHTFEVRLDRLDTVFSTGSLQPDHPRKEITQLGIASMQTNSRSLAGRLEAEFRPGVMVTEIVPGSMLSRYAENGWTIVGVMDIPVSNVDDLFEALGNYDLRDDLILDMIDRDGDFHQAKVRAERR